MKRSILPLFLVTIVSLAGAADKKITIDELCAYDKMCAQLKEGDNSIKKPKASIKKLVEKMAPSIIKYSKMYGVDPRAVGGAVLAENSLNVQIDDALQSWLAKNSNASAKAMSTMGMTVGPGQLNLEAAMAAEKHIASLGIRPARTPAEVQALLLTPSGSAEYAAAIIRQAQDVYAERGMDISKKPEILATLYNLGKYEEFADASKEKGTLPRPNYFGFFVQENIADVQDTIGWSPEKGQYKTLTKNFESPGTFAYLDKNTNLNLKSAPPTCRTSGAGQAGETNLRLTYKEYKTIQGGGLWADVIGATVDCQMQDWVQVRTDRGDIGWMKREHLEDAATERNDLSMSRTCEEPSSTCLDNVKKAYKTKAKVEPMRVGKSHEGVLMLPVKKNNDDDPADWRSRQSEDQVAANGGYGNCQGSYDDMKKAYSGQMGQQKPLEYKELSKAEMDLLVKRTEEKKAEIVKQFNLKSFDDPRNSFRSLFLYSHSLPACQRMKCEVSNPQDLATILNTDFGKIKGVAALNALQMKQFSVGLRESLSPEARKKADQELADSFRKQQEDSQKQRDEIDKKALEKTLAEFDETIRGCKEAIRIIPNLGGRLAKIKKDMETSSLPAGAMADFISLEKSCNSVRMIAKAKETGEREWGENDSMVNCMTSSGQGSSSTLIQTSLDMLVAIDMTADDYESITNGPLFEIENRIASFTRHQNMSYSSGLGNTKAMEDMLKGCNYNRLNTAKAIEELANSPCVSTVLVGDPDVMALLSANAKARIVRDVSLPGDKIGFTTTGSCRAEHPLRKPKELKGKFAE